MLHYASRINEYQKESDKTYADPTKGMDEYQKRVLINSELGSYLSQELMGNENAVNMLVSEDRSLAQKVYDGLKRFVAKVTNICHMKSAPIIIGGTGKQTACTEQSFFCQENYAKSIDKYTWQS